MAATTVRQLLEVKGRDPGRLGLNQQFTTP